MVPRRRVRLDQAPVVVEDRLERLGLLGRARREQRRNRAGLDRRQDGPLRERLGVVRHEVRNLMEHPSECGRIEVGQAIDLRGIEGRLEPRAARRLRCVGSHPRSLAWRHGSAMNEGRASGCV